MPATSPDLRTVARKAGKQAVWLAEHDLTPDKIVTMKSFENAIMVHAAISGSKTPFFIYRLLPESLALKLMEIPLTDCTEGLITC